MPKKDKEIEDDIIEDGDEITDDAIEIELELDSDDVSDIIEVEIDDVDIDDIKSEPDLSDISIYEENVVLSKHQQTGKHSLKHDSIFKGKIEDGDVDEVDYYVGKFNVDPTSTNHYESIENESYIRGKLVKEKVYDALLTHTDLNFMNNRRKPSKSDFNRYFHVVKTSLKNHSFSNVEIFNELSVYFSDNLFNMFKLLDNKWRNLIINELQSHIGNRKLDYSIQRRNISMGTEIEFQKVTSEGIKFIQGVVQTLDLDDDTDEIVYMVDSYESIHTVKFCDVKRVINHSQFKYNLNKLNNIDFL